jgi:predicted permease
MSGWRARLGDLLRLFGRRRADADVDAELAFHIDMQTERHVLSGMSREEARRRALVEFGGVERYRERTRDAHAGRVLSDLIRDIRQAGRSLARSPGYGVAAIAMLALGIGASTAMFTVVWGVLGRPLVYADAEQLYRVAESRRGGGPRAPSYPAFEDWAREAVAFESLTYIRGDEFRMQGEDGTQRLLAAYVSEDFFETFGTPPQLGRVLGGDDDGTAVVLSHQLWLSRFGGDPSMIGRTVSTSDGSHVVVGVMPAGFRMPTYADVWLPLDALPADGRYVLTRRDLHVDAEAWGRIRADVSERQAAQDLERVLAGLAAAYPEDSEWTGASLTPLRTHVLGNVSRQLRMLVVAVALVLLIACVNVAGLQLAHSSVRSRELVIRASLGAGRGRLVRQLLTETAVLAFIGGAAGVVVAASVVQTLARRLPTVLPRLDEVVVDWHVLGFALLVSVLAALLAGVLPALRTMSRSLSATAREQSGASTATARWRGALVVAQVALALMLATGSALLLRSLATLHARELGFSADDVMVLRAFPPGRYGDAQVAAELYSTLQRSVATVPGVQRVALSNHAPFAGGWMITRFDAGGPPPEQGENVLVRTVSSEYFDVMRTELIAGRLLRPADEVTRGSGVVINDAAARQFFGNESPIGRGITIHHSAQGREEFGSPIPTEIVGVVRSERYFGLEQDIPPAVFVPWTWMVWPNITLLARTSAAATALEPALREAVRRVEPDIPVAGPARQAQWRPLADFVGYSVQQRRLTAMLFTGFGMVALGLSLVGIFATTAYLVTRRSREIAIRSAVGASRTVIVRLVLGHAVRLAAIGAAIGVPASIAAATLLRSELVGVTPSDPATIAVATCGFLIAAVLAAALPAVRALRIEPAAALKAE